MGLPGINTDAIDINSLAKSQITPLHAVVLGGKVQLIIFR